MTTAISGKFHPAQPEKQLGEDEVDLRPIPAMVYQKNKKLGVQEHDLTSFESPPAGKSPAKKLSGPQAKAQKKENDVAVQSAATEPWKQPTKKLTE